MRKIRKKEIENHSQIKRVKPDLKKGLSKEEVKIRIDAKAINKSYKVRGKSHFNIIFTSFFTFFNVILYCLALVFFFFQLFYPDGLKFIPITKYGFLFVILCNALTSIVSQEISKKTVEKMKLIVDPNVEVIREGKTLNIKTDELVLDDLVKLKSGKEISCDLILLDGELLVDESMLTGESKPLLKKVGDELLSGSFVVSGNAICLANRVGNDTYVSKLEQKISSIKKQKSILMENIHKIIKYLLFCLFPIVIIVALKTYYVGDGINNWVFTPDIITKAGATLVGMIPIGMILLSSITLSESIYKLYKKKTMVQELYAIENLSRVDTLCLDKTGTLTTQNFVVEKVIQLDNSLDINKIMQKYLSASLDNNATSSTLLKYFGTSSSEEIERFESFDSIKKCSKAIFKNGDIYSLGAPDFIIKEEEIVKLAKKYASEGYRVIAFTKNNLCVALFLLKDELRKGIKDTLKYFADLDIDIRIISGDNPLTVKEVSKAAGLKDYDKYISMEGVSLDEIPELIKKYKIFGRTSPDQKQEIIKQLELNGHIVGYVGDGVNDTQSLRQANCSIALKSGADSTKAVSDVVLLDDDFSHLPDVLKEGRRVVANIQRSILLFLTKSIFIGLFSLSSIFMKEGMPIEIESIYVYEFISIALCGLLLSIENNKPIADDGQFVSKVLYKSFMFGLFMFIGAIIPAIINAFIELPNLPALITLNVTTSGLVILLIICKPLNKYTGSVFAVGVLLSILLLLSFPNIFLTPNYLQNAGDLTGQIQLVFESFFDLTIFKNFKYYEYLIVGIYLVLSIFIYAGIYYGFIYLLKFIDSFKNKDKNVNHPSIC